MQFSYYRSLNSLAEFALPDGTSDYIASAVCVIPVLVDFGADTVRFYSGWTNCYANALIVDHGKRIASGVLRDPSRITPRSENAATSDKLNIKICSVKCAPLGSKE